jgi:hypothetical protein
MPNTYIHKIFLGQITLVRINYVALVIINLAEGLQHTDFPIWSSQLLLTGDSFAKTGKLLFYLIAFIELLYIDLLLNLAL